MSSKRYSRPLVTVVAIILGFADVCAWAQEVFPVGSENKARATGSSIAARRGAAVLYNPSNLALSPAGRAYVEAGFLNLNYAYEHPSYDPVVVRTNTPIAAIGYGGKITGRLNLGVVFLPTRMGDMEINGVPTDVGGDVTPLQIITSEQAYLAGVGLGYSISTTWQLGISIMYRNEMQALDANVVGNPNTALSYKLTHNSVTPLFGQRIRIGPWVNTLTLTPATVKTYEGEFERVDAEDHHIALQNYLPAKLNLGLGHRVRNLQIEGEASLQAWSDGRRKVKGPSYQADDDADLRDTIDYSLAVSYIVNRRLQLTAGYSFKPSPWGSGQIRESGQRSIGADFGNLDGIDKQVIGLGTQMILSGNFRLDSSLYHARGERFIGENGAGAHGKQQLVLTAISSTLSMKF